MRFRHTHRWDWEKQTCRICGKPWTTLRGPFHTCILAVPQNGEDRRRLELLVEVGVFEFVFETERGQNAALTRAARAAWPDRDVYEWVSLSEDMIRAEGARLTKSEARDVEVGGPVPDPDCDPGRVHILVGEAWRKDFSGFESLLSPQSTKIGKTNAAYPRWLNVIMFLAPATMAGGPNLCPCHTPGCYGKAGENCIAGTGRLSVSPEVLIGRSRFFFGAPRLFRQRLELEIEHFARKARECRRRLALRLNGTSDVSWERRAGFASLFAQFPQVQFYDYTKVLSRLYRDGRAVRLPPNYHLTFSRSEENQDEVEDVVRRTPHNVAVVFSQKPGHGNFEAEPLRREWLGRRVIDGDKHDLRFLDPPRVVVGLRAKGKLRTAMRGGGPGRLFVVQD